MVVYFDSEKLDTLVLTEGVVRYQSLPEFNGFTDTKLFEITGVKYDGTIPYIHIWANRVGVVYKSMADGSIWQLIDYHIVQ